MLHAYYFSASNTTENVIKTLAVNLGIETEYHNLTSCEAIVSSVPANNDIALFAAPVHAGRLPSIAIEKFKMIKGHGQKCLAVVVYGNRNYDDSLLELCDVLKSNGFSVIAAAAFVAQHSLFPEVAFSRPDETDLKKITEFSMLIRKVLARESSLDINTVSGHRPYKKPAATPIRPKTDKNKCRKCGNCVHECPAGAISFEKPYETNADKCIACSRCVITCPSNARYFGGLKYRMIGPIFKKMCSTRREPEWFIAE